MRLEMRKDSSWFEMRRVVLGADMVAAVPRRRTAEAAFSTGCACRGLSPNGFMLSVELAWHA
jgi:hypothetical protein